MLEKGVGGNDNILLIQLQDEAWFCIFKESCQLHWLITKMLGKSVLAASFSRRKMEGKLMNEEEK